MLDVYNFIGYNFMIKLKEIQKFRGLDVLE